MGGEREKHWARLLIPGGGREGRKGGQPGGGWAKEKAFPQESQRSSTHSGPQRAPKTPFLERTHPVRIKSPSSALGLSWALASLSPSFLIHKMGLSMVATFLGE